MNNRFSRIVCGFLSVVMCIFSTVNVVNIRAEDADSEPVANAITATTTSITLVRNGNNMEINNYTEVKDGDELSLKFAWETIEDHKNIPPVTFSYDLSDVMKNISLDEQTIKTTDATYRIVGQMLYIDIEKGKSGRSGTCSLSGTIDLDNAQVDNEGRIEISFVDMTLTPKAPSLVTGLQVNKSAGAFEKDGDKYYQNFTVQVYNYSQMTVSGAVLTDTLGPDSNLFAGTTLENYQILDSNGSVYQNYNGTVSVSAGASITLPDIPSQKDVKITYRVEVDKDKALKGIGGNNRATVGYSSSGDSKIAEGQAWANPSIPKVEKTGVLDPDTKDKITWTIKVTPNDIADDADFVIIDAPDGISASEIHDLIPGSELVDNDTAVKIPKTAMGSPDNGTYTIEYTTELTDEYKNQILDKYIKNDIEVTFTIDNDSYVYTGSSSVQIKGMDVTYADKTATEVDYEAGIIKWESKIYIPNDDSAENPLSSYKFSDWVNGSISGIGNSTGFSKFADDINDTILIDGAPFTDEMGTFILNYNKDTIDIEFSADFINAHHDKTVTISYETYIDKTVENYADKIYTNSSKVQFNYADWTGRSQQADAFVAADFVSNKKVKSVNYNNTSKPNVLGWVINHRSVGYTYKTGDAIIITDSLPVGYRLIEDSIGMQTESYEGNYFTETAFTYTTSVSNDVQTITVTVPVTEELKTELNRNQYGLGNYVSIGFDACMTDEYYENFNKTHSSGVAVDITNTANITVGDKSIDVSNTQQVTPSAGDIITKTVISQNQIFEKDPETGDDVATNTFIATYEVVVNEAKEDLITAPDTDLVFTDKLGTWLDIDLTSITTTPTVPAENISYNKITREVRIVLDDATKYTIRYNVKGRCAIMKESGNDVGVDSSQIDGMFSNTASLYGENNTVFSDSTGLQESTYKAKASYSYNVTLTGRKIWTDGSNKGFVPDSITIRIKRTKIATDGTRTVETVEESAQITNNDGEWEYTIDNIQSMDNDGNRYEYEIEEIKVGGDSADGSGFTVDYAEAVTEDDDMVIEFTNEFTADDDEIGALKVTKVWDHTGNNAPPEESVTVTLYEVVGNTEIKVGESQTITNGNTVIFENLPLYTYSRDANDKLVRELRQYKVVESAVGGYKTTYSIDGAFALTDVVAAGTTVSAEDAKVVTITNTYEAPLPEQKFGAISITKNWEDGNNAENLRPESITFVLKADGVECDRRTVTGETAEFTALPVFREEGNTVTDQKIVYSVEELEIKGYTTTYTGNTNIELEDGVTDYVTVTNTFSHIIKKGNVSVSKVWQDIFGNTDNEKNDSVNVTLYADGVAVTTKPTPASFTDLRLHKYSRADDGSIIETPINYTVTEETVDGYTVSYELDGVALDGSFNLTTDATSNVTVTNKKNARSQEEGSIAVTKVWDDTANTENIVLPVITVTLSSDDGAQDRTATITYPELTASFTNLPVYKVVDGVVTDTKVTYAVTESSVDGYGITYTDNTGIQLEKDATDNVTVKNTFDYIIEKGSVSISKVWQTSAGAVDNTKDDSVSVTLYADSTVVGTKTVTPSTPAVFDDLPVYKYSRDNNGNIVKTAIEYKLSETPVDGYITSYTIGVSELNGSFDLEADSTRDITVTNRKESPDQKHGAVKVTKVWNDNNSPLRPETITVVLKSDDGAGDRTDTIIAPATEVTFTGLPVFKTDANGNVTNENVTYTVEEITIDGYNVTYTGNENIQLTENGIAEVTVTNTLAHTPQKGGITVNKLWQDENGGALPENEKVDISVTLSDTVDSTPDQLYEITTDKTFITIDNLPVYESYERNANGIIVGVNPITYYVTETAVNGFETTYSVSPSSGLSLVTSSTGEVTITNKKKSEALGSIKVTKNWFDTANTAGIAHPAITVVLKADGVQTATKTIAATESTATFENLPVYKPDGITEIQYSVVEQTVVGYDTVSYSPAGSFVLSENGVTDVTITNTFDYELKKGHISVTKKWVDSDGSDLAINDTITVEIKVGDTLVASDTIAGSGTKTFYDLPLYTYTRNNDGSISENDIIYTVTETSAVSGYTVSYTLDGAAHEGGFKLKADDTRAVVIENKKIAVTPPSSSESQSSQSTVPSGGSGGEDDSDDNGDSSETTPSQGGSDTTPSQGGSDTTPSQGGSDTTPSQSSSDTTPSQGGSGTRPSYTTPSYVQTTATVKNTTTTTAVDTTKGDGTTAPDEEPEETTVIDEDTDTTKPAEPDDYEEDDGEDAEDSEDYEPDDSEDADDSESEDEEDEMQDEDGDIDDYIGEDTDFETNIEENPHTSITINTGYVLSFAFGTYAFFPRKKKKK